MIETSVKNTVIFSQKDYSRLVDAYKKIGEILVSKKTKTNISFPKFKSLYGVWENIKVNEKDFETAKKSLFKFFP